MSDKSKIRVALADDHTMFRRGVVTLISSVDDMEVVAEAVNGIDLLEAVERLLVKPDVCILDVNMPRLNGYDTLVELKKHYGQSMQFLILTMLDHEVLILRMVRAGAKGYVLKEEEPELLLEAVREVAAGEYFTAGRAGRAIFRGVRNEHIQNSLALSERDVEFLKLIITDLNYKEIGERLGVSQRTAEGYRDALFRRFDIKSRIGLALAALRLGLVNL